MIVDIMTYANFFMSILQFQVVQPVAHVPKDMVSAVFVSTPIMSVLLVKCFKVVVIVSIACLRRYEQRQLHLLDPAQHYDGNNVPMHLQDLQVQY